MPRTRSTVHPLIHQAVDTAVREVTIFTMPNLDEEARRGMEKYQQLHLRRLVPSFVTGALMIVALGLMATSFEEGMIKPGIAAALAMLAMGGFLFAQVQNLWLSWEELAAVAPALRLTRIQRAYLDSRLALRTLTLPEETETELVAQLDRLVDEEARLRAMRDQGDVRGARPEEIEAERDDLRRRLAETSDPMMREALEDGLRTSERRLAPAQRLSLAVGRIDAQLEMIAQSASDVRDGLLRLRMMPESNTGVELAPIRQTLAHVQNHAAAIEAAVVEVQEIGGRP